MIRRKQKPMSQEQRELRNRANLSGLAPMLKEVLSADIRSEATRDRLEELRSQTEQKRDELLCKAEGWLIGIEMIDNLIEQHEQANGLRAHGVREHDGSDGSATLWWLLDGQLSEEQAHEQLAAAGHHLTGFYYAGPGRRFWETPWTRSTRTRTLVTQHTGLDV